MPACVIEVHVHVFTCILVYIHVPIHVHTYVCMYPCDTIYMYIRCCFACRPSEQGTQVMTEHTGTTCQHLMPNRSNIYMYILYSPISHSVNTITPVTTYIVSFSCHPPPLLHLLPRPSPQLLPQTVHPGRCHLHQVVV